MVTVVHSSMVVHSLMDVHSSMVAHYLMVVHSSMFVHSSMVVHIDRYPFSGGCPFFDGCPLFDGCQLFHGCPLFDGCPFFKYLLSNCRVYAVNLTPLKPVNSSLQFARIPYICLNVRRCRVFPMAPESIFNFDEQLSCSKPGGCTWSTLNASDFAFRRVETGTLFWLTITSLNSCWYS